MSENLKVLFHIDNAPAQALKVIKQTNNLLKHEPGTKIAIIVSGLGFPIVKKDFSIPEIDNYYQALSDAKKQGDVTITVCTFSAEFHGITEEELHEDLIDAWVPSTSGLITRLQVREKYAYHKP